MPVFHDYRRFPHIDSLISDRAKYGVFTSQLHRFAHSELIHLLAIAVASFY